MPGAFTPTCHSQAPGYIEKYDEFKAKGINEIHIVCVNDVFVTKYAPACRTFPCPHPHPHGILLAVAPTKTYPRISNVEN